MQTSIDQSTIQERFERFHADNPLVYELLVRFALDVKAAGRTRYSVKTLVERVRWHVAIETRGDEFKINNDFTSRYARMLDDDPRFTGMFFLRELRAA